MIGSRRGLLSQLDSQPIHHFLSQCMNKDKWTLWEAFGMDLNKRERQFKTTHPPPPPPRKSYL